MAQALLGGKCLIETHTVIILMCIDIILGGTWSFPRRCHHIPEEKVMRSYLGAAGELGEREEEGTGAPCGARHPSAGAQPWGHRPCWGAASQGLSTSGG